MTTFRSFGPRDLPVTAFGLFFGVVYGIVGVLCLWFVLFDFGWFIVLLGLPLLAIQLATILALDRYLKWRRRNDPPPPPISWARNHAMSLGAGAGALATALFMLAGFVFSEGTL